MGCTKLGLGKCPLGHSTRLWMQPKVSDLFINIWEKHKAANGPREHRDNRHLELAKMGYSQERIFQGAGQGLAGEDSVWVKSGEIRSTRLRICLEEQRFPVFPCV